MLPIALPHSWEDEGELVLHLLEEHNSADSLDVTHKASDSMHYVLSTSWHANTKLHREDVPWELLLEVTHDGRADKIVEDGPYGNGPYATIFLGYGNQPSTKEVWSEVF